MQAWGESPQGFDTLGQPVDDGPAKSEIIELVGPHLRVSGTISLLRFNRLSDLVNHTSGFVRLTEARLLRRNGEPTNLIVPELMVNQDEITFIGQTPEDVSTVTDEHPAGRDGPAAHGARPARAGHLHAGAHLDRHHPPLLRDGRR